MRRRNTTLLCNNLFRALPDLNPEHPQIVNQINQVSFLLPPLSFLRTKLRHYADFGSLDGDSVSASSREKIAQTQIESCILKSVIDSISGLNDENEKFRPDPSSLKDLLLSVSDIVPDISRRFRRFSLLKPEDVLELLQYVESECREVEVGKVDILWKIFNWAAKQYKGFKHLPQSCEIMESMLIRADMLREAELLLMEMESKGDILDNQEILSNLIEKYVGAGDLKKAVYLFDWMRGRNLLPSVSCFSALIDLLVQVNKNELAYQVCLDLMTVGTKLNNAETSTFDRVIELLCLDKKILEARNLLRKLMFVGFEPSNSTVNKIASGYCKKLDFEDLLSFFAEMKCAPDASTGNKIIHVVCRKFGSYRGNCFRKELENLGFKVDEITLGILIGWSCHEGDMRTAFVYLSEIFSRGLKPDLHTYNAVIGGVFRKGMWQHARLVLDEMLDNGISPNTSTFRILLAGYCKARRFEDAKMIVQEMVSHGFLEKSSFENPLSQAFDMLGFDPLAVSLKRDNHAGLSKAEFFDDLGNGLYLDTDLDEYERRVNMVLHNSAIPNFNSLVMREYRNGNLESALGLVDDMVRWGQALSYHVFSSLLTGLCASRSLIRASLSLLEKWPNLSNQLEEKTLNVLIQESCRKGLADKGRIFFQRMVQMNYPVYAETYTRLIKGLGKKGPVKDLQTCLVIARKDKWLPQLDDYEPLLVILIRRKMRKEAIEFLESMLLAYPHLQSEMYNTFLEKLCVMGFSRIAQLLMEKLVENSQMVEDSVYNNLIKGFCKEKQYSAAYATLKHMLAQNLVPCLDVSLIFIARLCRTNKLDEAIALRNICLKNHSASTSSINCALINGFCSMGGIAEAENLYTCMFSNGVQPAGDVYHWLFQGYCQAKNLRKVGEVLGILIRKNTGLSIEIYRNYVRMMCTEGDFAHVLSLKELMLKMHNLDSIIIYNLLIFYLFRAKNHWLVKKVLDEMQEKEVLLDRVAYNFLVHGFSSCQDLSSAIHHFNSMISSGFEPNNRSLLAAVTSLCSLGDLGKVLDLSKEMESRGQIHGSAMQTKIVESLISNGKTQEAESFLIRLKVQDLLPRTIEYDPLIHRFCHIGKLDIAVDLLNTMLKKRNIPASSSYDSIISGFSKCNNLDKAMDFLTEMLDHGLKPSMNSWKMLVGGFCEKGETAEAEKLVKLMVQLGETPSRENYNIVINQYRVAKNVGKASEIMQLMQKSGYKPDFDSHWSVISNLSVSNEKANKNSQGFLSRLLSGSGFSWKRDVKSK